MNVSIRGASAFFLMGLFLVLPFIAVLKYKLPIYSFGDFSLSGSVKDVLALGFVIFAVLALSRIRVLVDRFSVLLAIFVLWMAVRTVTTIAPLGDAINSFRVEGVYPLFFLLFYVTAKSYGTDVVFLHRKASILVTLQLVTVVLIAFVEHFDKDIRHVFYGEKADNLVTGFPGVEEIRLVSTLENPINLGLFLCVGILFAYSLLRRTRKLGLLPVLVAMSLPVVALTFSRTATVLFAVLALVLIARSWFASGFLFKAFSVMFVVCAAAAISHAFIATEEVSEALEKRMDQTVSVESVSSDPRFENWSFALERVESASPVFTGFGAGMGLSNPRGEGGALRIENSFVTVWVQLGLVGLLLFVFLLAHPFIPMADVRSEADDERRSLLFVSRGMMFILVVAGLSADVHRNSPFSFYLWYFITFAALLRSQTRVGRSAATALHAAA